jgi:hypothetical protein
MIVRKINHSKRCVMPNPLILNINLHDDVDQSELDILTHQMRDEISALDVCYAELPHGGDAPFGAKGDPITIGSIAVALASAGVFTGLVEMLKSWVLRREGRLITIKAEVDGRKLEMTFSPSEASEKEMTAFAQKIFNVLESPRRRN